MTKWYVTIDKHSSHIAEPDECVWTISRDPGCTGWNTDSGHFGYGLTKADAEELANAANEIERLRAALFQIAHQKYGSQMNCVDNYNALQTAARAALGEKKDD